MSFEFRSFNQFGQTKKRRGKKGNGDLQEVEEMLAKSLMCWFVFFIRGRYSADVDIVYTIYNI